VGVGVRSVALVRGNTIEKFEVAARAYPQAGVQPTLRRRSSLACTVACGSRSSDLGRDYLHIDDLSFLLLPRLAGTEGLGRRGKRLVADHRERLATHNRLWDKTAAPV